MSFVEGIEARILRNLPTWSSLRLKAECIGPAAKLFTRDSCIRDGWGSFHEQLKCELATFFPFRGMVYTSKEMV